MERLIERVNGKLALKKKFPTIEDTLDIVTNRLELYEDTGFTPEQIQAQQQEIFQYKSSWELEKGWHGFWVKIAESRRQEIEDWKEAGTIASNNNTRLKQEIAQLKADNARMIDTLKQDKIDFEVIEKITKYPCKNACEAIEKALSTSSEPYHNPEDIARIEALTADKDEQAGRLIVLPCKVGDTVHVLTTDSLNGVEETSINRIVIKKNSIILNADCKNDDWGRAAWDFRPSDFGKTVFLTREAAEKALGGAEDETNPV